MALVCSSISAMKVSANVVSMEGEFAAVVVTRGGINHGDYPVLKTKGDNPVDAFSVFIMSKWTLGSAFTHPFQFRSMWKWRH